ncbi:MAG: hypothetical protein EOP87_22480 [Verrucomicrobiaceae bacterium]|nr:MAG: hypothetical protein EOP87_22480 [Verrucomicrobiaceae bacterium]
MRISTITTLLCIFVLGLLANGGEIVPEWLVQEPDVYWITSTPEKPDEHYLIQIKDPAVARTLAGIFKAAKPSNDLRRNAMDRGDSLSGWLVFRKEDRIWALNVWHSMERQSAVLGEVREFGSGEIILREKSLVDGVKADQDFRKILATISISYPKMEATPVKLVENY